MNDATRSKVSWASERDSASGRSCLGRLGDESGQKRVPDPPARMTAQSIARPGR